MECRIFALLESLGIRILFPLLEDIDNSMCEAVGILSCINNLLSLLLYFIQILSLAVIVGLGREEVEVKVCELILVGVLIVVIPYLFVCRHEIKLLYIFLILFDRDLVLEELPVCTEAHACAVCCREIGRYRRIS